MSRLSEIKRIRLKRLADERFHQDKHDRNRHRHPRPAGRVDSPSPELLAAAQKASQ